MVEFLSDSLFRFGDAPNHQDYWISRENSRGYISDTPNPMRLWVRVFDAWSCVDGAHAWLDHHRMFVGRPILIERPLSPKTVFPAEDFYPEWSARATHMVTRQVSIIEKSIPELVRWVATHKSAMPKGDYEWTEGELALARMTFTDNPYTKVETLRKQFKDAFGGCAAEKAQAMVNLMRQEGLCRSTPKSPKGST